MSGDEILARSLKKLTDAAQEHTLLSIRLRKVRQGEEAVLLSPADATRVWNLVQRMLAANRYSGINLSPDERLLLRRVKFQSVGGDEWRPLPDLGELAWDVLRNMPRPDRPQGEEGWEAFWVGPTQLANSMTEIYGVTTQYRCDRVGHVLRGELLQRQMIMKASLGRYCMTEAGMSACEAWEHTHGDNDAA